VCMEPFESMLTGGHPNSLGRTVEVVTLVLADQNRLRELVDCYESPNEVVRLRVSSALKRIEAEQHSWLVPYLDELIGDVGQLDQASVQWTLAQLFSRYTDDLTPAQQTKALALMKRNLTNHTDWIVLITTMETLSEWASTDDKLKKWLEPHVKRLANDSRKSVAGSAIKKRKQLFGE
jgi:hypothetical protein